MIVLWLAVRTALVRSRFAVAMLGGREQIVPLKHSAQRTAILQVGAVLLGNVSAQMASAA